MSDAVIVGLISASASIVTNILLFVNKKILIQIKK